MMFKSLTTGLVAVLASANLAAAHIELSFPAPFRSKFNPNAGSNIDYSYTAPLSASGSDFPCKGYHSDFGTPAGKSTATFAPGGTYNFTTAGTATHGGGSCQVSLSYDGGKTFTVIESIIGGCPLQASYDFTIPADSRPGEAIFSWTWFNQIGNREMYMNCAPVTIGGGGSSGGAKRAAAFTTRPQIFVANVGNGCGTEEGAPVQIPNPGPDVVNGGGTPKPPTGNCPPASGGGGGGGSAPEPPAPTNTPPSAAAPSPTAGIPGGVFITIDTSSSSAAAPTPAPSAPADVPPPPPAAPVPTTLQTATKPAPPAPTGTGGSVPAPAPAPAPPRGAYTIGTTCTDEGAWNCINGTAFQRCASGGWSAVIQMAAGTSCKAGVAATLDMGAATRKRTTRRSLRGGFTRARVNQGMQQ